MWRPDHIHSGVVGCAVPVGGARGRRAPLLRGRVELLKCPGCGAQLRRGLQPPPFVRSISARKKPVRPQATDHRMRLGQCTRNNLWDASLQRQLIGGAYEDEGYPTSPVMAYCSGLWLDSIAQPLKLHRTQRPPVAHGPMAQRHRRLQTLQRDGNFFCYDVEGGVDELCCSNWDAALTVRPEQRELSSALRVRLAPE
jgi:hypothetical protein